MAKDMAWVARMAGRLPDELHAAQLRGVREGALHVTRAIRAEIRVASGGDMRLSGANRGRGARVGARFDVKGSVNPTALVKATGPLQLLEHDMPPHDMVPRGRRVSKRWAAQTAKGKTPKGAKHLAGAKAMRLPDGRFIAHARHPGTRAKKPFERGYLRSRGDTGLIFDQAVQDGIRRAMR